MTRLTLLLAMRAPSSTLRGDLDMDDVSLYAVVARVEREAKVALTDAQIEEWETLGDLLDAVAQAACHD